MRFYPYTNRGGGKCLSHAGGGGGITNIYGVVFTW